MPQLRPSAAKQIDVKKKKCFKPLKMALICYNEHCTCTLRRTGTQCECAFTNWVLATGGMALGCTWVWQQMPLTGKVRKLLPLEFSFVLITPRRRSQLGTNRSLTLFQHLFIASITIFTGVGSELLAGLLVQKAEF